MDARAIVLAAGAGTRMKSSKPKVAHEMLGKPMVRWVVDAAKRAGCSEVHAVIGTGAEVVEPLLPDCSVSYQLELLGTGHAVMCAADKLEDFEGSLVILCGDTPLITAETIRGLIASHEESGAACTVLTMTPADPTGYGRIIRDTAGQVTAIVEQKDCSSEQAAVTECNSGVYCFDAPALLERLGRLTTDNAQGEYYLTDILGLMRADGLKVGAAPAASADDCLGVNSRSQLARATKVAQHRINEQHMADGATMLDPDQVWIGPDVRIGTDVEILPQTYLWGSTSIDDNCVIGPNTRLTDCTVGDSCRLEETVGIDAVIDHDVSCGPRAYLRQGTHLCAGSKVGTHVEIKNSTIGEGSKVPHLSYIGDCTMGADVNVGAGSITCNYDGKDKHPTAIGDHSFIGSDTMLVAPVSIGSHTVIGAASCITEDVPDHALALERSRQIIKKDYVK